VRELDVHVGRTVYLQEGQGKVARIFVFKNYRINKGRNLPAKQKWRQATKTMREKHRKAGN